MGASLEEPRIRRATRADLPALVRIYNHYVTNTHITFDTVTFSAEERLPWLESFSPSGPYRLLLVEDSSRPVGYASSIEYKAKPAYRPSVETTIYLDPAFCGRGVGRVLYGRLLEELKSEHSLHRAYAGIALPNSQSVSLHEKLGFRLVGTFREAGLKFGKYWDVSWYEKDLSS